MEYLLALAAVTRLVRDERFRQSLQEQASSEEIEQLSATPSTKA